MTKKDLEKLIIKQELEIRHLSKGDAYASAYYDTLKVMISLAENEYREISASNIHDKALPNVFAQKVLTLKTVLRMANSVKFNVDAGMAIDTEVITV